MANVAVNATISARDAASKNIKTVNNALGTLGKTAGQIGADFKKLALGIAGIAAGVGAFTVSAIKDAAADQAATEKLNAALKARGLATKSVMAAVERQISLGQKLAFTDDEVRASVEASTRFTKKYADAQKIQNVAMDLARATGMSLADATLAVGKAYQGNGGKLLKTLGIEGKAIKGQQALNAILGKTKGSAKAYGDTLEGSFSTLAIGAAELKEQFGNAFLPAVTKLFKGLAPYLDRFAHLIEANTPKLQRWADLIVTKILAKLPSLFAEFEANVPRAIIGVEQFIDKVAGIGKEADKLLGPGGSITLLISGIAAAFGGLKAVIATNLIKNGMDPFTALIVANIAAQIPASLAAALTSAVVSRAVAAFGTSVAASTAAGAAASGAGAAAGGGSLLALLGAAALPVTIVALSVAATAALTSAITAKGQTGLFNAGVASGATTTGPIDIFGTTAATLMPPRTTPRPTYAVGNVGTSFGAPGNVTVVSNVSIGTGKVDTVISDSIKRTGTFSRGR